MARWHGIRLTAAIVAACAALPMAPALAAGPSPQRAPATTPAPSPDPAPAAQTHPRSTTTPATHVPTSSPSISRTVTPSQPPVVSTTPQTSAEHHRARRHAVTKVARRHKATAHHRRAPAPHPSPVARPVPAVPATHVAARPAARHNHGVMLLVGGLVLLALVAASLTLLRMANRLQREIMGSAV
jgi:hypothetical protein